MRKVTTNEQRHEDEMVPEIWVPDRINFIPLEGANLSRLLDLKDGLYYAADLHPDAVADPLASMTQLHTALTKVLDTQHPYYAGNGTSVSLGDLTHLFKPLTTAEQNELANANVNPITPKRTGASQSPRAVAWGNYVRHTAKGNEVQLTSITDVVAVWSTIKYIQRIAKAVYEKFLYKPDTDFMKHAMQALAVSYMEKLRHQFNTRAVSREIDFEVTIDHATGDLWIVVAIHRGYVTSKIPIQYNLTRGLLCHYEDLDEIF